MKKIVCILFYSILVFSCADSSDDLADMNGDQNDIEPLQGVFQNGAHPTSGMASIDIERTTLSFTSDFMTDPGPLLEVYLCDSAANCDDFITLGELKNTSGPQEYMLPENINFNNYQYVHIWCVTFSVSFGYAKID